jgi:hypothetical protein
MYPPLKDRSNLVVGECSLTEGESRTLKDDFLAMTDRLGKLHWSSSLPWSKGVCGRNNERDNDTSICAVHRWNSHVENKLIGRVQCWTDPSLLHWDPTFLNNYPLFHPVFVNVTTDFVCLVDIPGYAATLAGPSPFLQINKLTFRCPSVFDDAEDFRQIRKGDLPVDVLQLSLKPFFFRFLNEFLVHDNDEEDDEIIDLDLMES